jgi:transposase-like protein
MPTKKDIEIFIYEKGSASWSDLENFFAIAPRSKKETKVTCPKCKSLNLKQHVQAFFFPNVRYEKTESYDCPNCGAYFTLERVSRQTLLNYINELVREDRVEKVIDKTTLRPIYRINEKIKDQTEIAKLKKDLQTTIEYMTFDEVQKLKVFLDKRTIIS